MVFLTNLLNYKRHITESDNGYVPYCILQCCFFTVPYRFTLFSNTMNGVKKPVLVLLPYRFTLFSNKGATKGLIGRILLPYRFTLFSNEGLCFKLESFVLLPYRFTLFSNRAREPINKPRVLPPYRFTLFSNLIILLPDLTLFYYLIDLHYSQTPSC